MYCYICIDIYLFVGWCVIEVFYLYLLRFEKIVLEIICLYYSEISIESV